MTLSLAVVRDSVVSVLCVLGVTAPAVFRSSMAAWLAAVNYRLEEGTVEMDWDTGMLRFRIAMPVVYDHPSTCALVKYLVSCARYNSALLRRAAAQFLGSWLHAAASGQPPTLRDASAAVQGISGINGQLVGVSPARSAGGESAASDASGARNSAFSPSNTNQEHSCDESDAAHASTAHGSRGGGSELEAPQGSSPTPRPSLPVGGGAIRGAPTPFNSPVPVAM